VGLSAVVAACPYDIPPHLPGVLMVLADHLHDPQPISATVKLVLQDFKRTHQDNWAEHKVGNMCVCVVLTDIFQPLILSFPVGCLFFVIRTLIFILQKIFTATYCNKFLCDLLESHLPGS
jgi:hypothetical protein